MMRKLLNIILLLCCSAGMLAERNTLPKWALGGFVRPEGVNPLVSPVDNTQFLCPMTGVKVKWECADTFNPAAVVKDGKVCILYRAEDNPNVGIGKRTSRIGYVESADGITVDYRQKTPVMFPDSSAMSMQYEWTGGCEDPRVIEAEADGSPLYVMTYTSYDRKTARLSVATSRAATIEDNIDEQFIPNPFDAQDIDKLHDFPHGPTTIYLLDVTGKLVAILNGDINSVEVNKSTFPISTGVYFLKAYIDNRWYTKKILVR